MNVEVVDVKGNHVKTPVDSYMLKGARSFQWDAKNENGNLDAAGGYIYELVINQKTKRGKIVYLK